MSGIDLFGYAKYEGVSMSELGKRGGCKAAKIKRRKKRLQDEYEKIKQKGGDYWNR